MEGSVQRLEIHAHRIAMHACFKYYVISTIIPWAGPLVFFTSIINYFATSGDFYS